MTETLSSVVTSEIRATGANIKQQQTLNIPFIDEQLKRIQYDYRKHEGTEIDSRGVARLVLADLKEHDVDAAVINEFARVYVGG